MADIDATKPAEGDYTSKGDVRANTLAIKGRVEGLPDSRDPAGNLALPHVGKIVVIGADGARVAASADVITLDGARLVNLRLDGIAVTDNLALADAGHSGRLLEVDGSDEITLTASPAGGGGGISDGFAVTILRKGTGEVAIATTGGLTLRHPDDHTRLGPRWSTAGLILSGSDLILVGKTAE